MQQSESGSLSVGHSPNDSRDKVILGHVTGVVGLHGWVKVHSDTNPRNNIVGYKRWWLKQSGHWKQWAVTDGRPQGKTIVAKLEGVATPEAAAALIGSIIAVERCDMPALGADEYYWTDLTGLLVKTVDGLEIGPVLRLFETGANDVVVVADHRADTGSAYEAEVLIPWIQPDVITKVDLDKRTITVDWDPDF